MAKKTSRVRLNRQQKQALCDHHQAHPEKSLRVLCKWAQQELQLALPPSPAALQVLFKKGAHADRAIPTTTKTLRQVTCPRLEAELVLWISLCEQLELPFVSGSTIRAKANMIRDKIAKDSTSPTNKALEQLVFSKGWLQKLQKRHGLKSRRVHGEAASVSSEAVEKGRLELQQITSAYSKRDTFNIDETAFFYCMLPTTSISKSTIAGRKKVKKRLTVALASNADGSYKLPLLFVGTARQPRCFGGKTGKELGVEYTSAPKGWMNTQLFRSWIERFNAQMKDEQRQVLLLLDNASCHRVNETLSNVAVQRLPPNTTAHLQPQDAGIIQSFKAQINHQKHHYYVRQLDNLLERVAEVDKESISEHTKLLFDVDVLTAMRWAQQAWAAVTSATIENCWRHTQILDEEIYELQGAMEKLRVGAPSIRQLSV